MKYNNNFLPIEDSHWSHEHVTFWREITPSSKMKKDVMLVESRFTPVLEVKEPSRLMAAIGYVGSCSWKWCIMHAFYDFFFIWITWSKHRLLGQCQILDDRTARNTPAIWQPRCITSCPIAVNLPTMQWLVLCLIKLTILLSYLFF